MSRWVFCALISSTCLFATTGVAQAVSYGLESGTPPTNTAAPYASEFFSNRQNLTRFGLAISDDGQECYFAVALNDNGRFREEIRITRRNQDGSWTDPVPLLANEKKYKYVDPHFSADGQRLFFIYTKPADSSSAPKQQRFDIWYVDRNKGGGWGSPVNVAAPISTTDAHEYYVSLTSKQTMFFGSNRAAPNNFDLYSAEPGANGTYQPPKPPGRR